MCRSTCTLLTGGTPEDGNPFKIVRQLAAQHPTPIMTKPVDSPLVQLRELCGYVEDGSDTTIQIFQDDATRTWHLKVGRFKEYWAEGFEAVIAKASEAQRAAEQKWEAQKALVDAEHPLNKTQL